MNKEEREALRVKKFDELKQKRAEIQAYYTISILEEFKNLYVARQGPFDYATQRLTWEAFKAFCESRDLTLPHPSLFYLVLEPLGVKLFDSMPFYGTKSFNPLKILPRTRWPRSKYNPEEL